MDPVTAGGTASARGRATLTQLLIATGGNQPGSLGGVTGAFIYPSPPDQVLSYTLTVSAAVQ
jgi:hypothetical protein